MTLEEAMLAVWRQVLLEGKPEVDSGGADVPGAEDAEEALARSGF